MGTDGDGKSATRLDDDKPLLPFPELPPGCDVDSTASAFNTGNFGSILRISCRLLLMLMNALLVVSFVLLLKPWPYRDEDDADADEEGLGEEEDDA